MSFRAAAGLLLTGVFLLAPPGVFAQTSPSPPAPWDDPALSDDVQDWSDEVPAHISFVDGDVWLDRDGTIEDAPAGVPLLAGDRVRTRAGRLEILFADGSVLLLDEHTDVELLDDDLLRVDTGRVRLDLSRAAGSIGYRIDAAGTTTWIRAAGEYRLDIDNRQVPADVRLVVIRGQAELSANGRRTLVRAGHEAFASAETTPSLSYAVTVSSWDAFDRWWDDRRTIRAGVATAQYLPAEVSSYAGVLDRDGDWQYESTHGYVWYPRVTDTWHPYSAGRWSFVGSYGWVWIGADRWAWPTHHYGRWGYSGQRYYWIPGRHWAPAWVAWASSPGYVGWVPLGYDNRPLISINIGYSSGWRGWTHVPTRSFNTRVVVAQRGRYLPPRNVLFNDGYRGPGRPSTVIVRQTQGLRGPGRVPGRGSVAVPRVSIDRASVPSGRMNGPAASAPGRAGAPTGRFRGPGADNTPPASRVAPAGQRRQPEAQQAERPAPGGSRQAPARASGERAAPARPSGERGAPAPSTERTTPPADTPAPRSAAPSRAPEGRAPDTQRPSGGGVARPRAGAVAAPTAPEQRAVQSAPAVPQQRAVRPSPAAASVQRTVRPSSSAPEPRAVRPQPTPADSGARQPAFRGRLSSAPDAAPASRVMPAPARQAPAPDRSRASASSSRERPAMRTPDAAPAARVERPAMRAPASSPAPRAERERPSARTPASTPSRVERSQPAARQAPANAPRGESAPRGRATARQR